MDLPHPGARAHELKEEEVEQYLTESLTEKDISASKEFLLNIIKKLVVSKEKELGIDY